MSNLPQIISISLSIFAELIKDDILAEFTKKLTISPDLFFLEVKIRKGQNLVNQNEDASLVPADA